MRQFWTTVLACNWMSAVFVAEAVSPTVHVIAMETDRQKGMIAMVFA
jgi:hypothetical protein